MLGISIKEGYKMAKKPLVPGAREELDKLKLEVANEIGIHNNNINRSDTSRYKGNMTSQQTGKMAGTQYVGNIGGQMVSKLIEKAERDLANKENNK